MTDNIPQSQETSPQETEAVSLPPAESTSRLASILGHPKTPLVAGAAVLAIAAGVAFSLKAPGFGGINLGRPAIVTFDPVKFTNSQRAAASLMAMSPNADTALSLTQVAKQAESVIRQEAHGAVVLVKQAVVAPEGIPDITDAVLDRFGLSKQVPTITTRPAEQLEDVAPTDSAFSAGKLREDYRMELEQKRARISEQQAQQSKQEGLLP